MGDSHQLRGALAVVVAASAHPYRLALFSGTTGAVAASQPANERAAMKAAVVFCALALLAGQAGDFAAAIGCGRGRCNHANVGRGGWGNTGPWPSCPLLLRFWPIGSLQASLRRRANRAHAQRCWTTPGCWLLPQAALSIAGLPCPRGSALAVVRRMPQGGMPRQRRHSAARLGSRRYVFELRPAGNARSAPVALL